MKDNLEESDPGILKHMLLRGDKDNQNALQLAVYNSNKDTVTHLLDWVKDNLEESDPGILKHMLLRGDKDNQNALQLAVYNSNKDTVTHLLDWVKDNLEESDPGILKHMLLRGDKDNQNVLQIAVYKGNKDVVTHLLNWMIDNLKKEFLYSLVYEITGDESATYSIISNKNNSGKLLKYANYRNGKPQRLEPSHRYTQEEMLDEKNKWIHLGTNKKIENLKVILSGSLFEAYRTDNYEVLPALVQFIKYDTKKWSIHITFEDVALKFQNAETILHRVAKWDHKKSVTVLLDWVKKNFPETLKELLLQGDKDKKTALHQSAEGGHKEIVEALLDSVKDKPETLKELLLQGDKDKKTALELIINNGRQSVIDFLELQYDVIASSLLKKDIYNFTDEQLTILNKYVESNDYTAENKKEILGAVVTR